MENKFELHKEVYCVYCGEFYKADILSVKKNSDSEIYEVELINYSNQNKILEYEEDEIFSTMKELITAIRSEHEKYISNMYIKFKNRYKFNN